MCFKTTRDAKAKIAQSDIKCWKVLKYDNSPQFGGLTSSYSHKRITPYEKNVVQPCVVFGKMKMGPSMHIYQGYHSYRTRKAAKERANSIELVKRFIIPAKTLYYENDTEYVSKTIMLVE